MDPLAAGLAVPAAIKATLDVIEKLTGGQNKKPDELIAGLKDIGSNISDIRASLIDFSRVTIDLRPWKYAHHSTNLVLYREMDVLFGWNKPDLVRMFRDGNQRIELELGKVNRGDSCKAFLQSKSDAELALVLPEAIVRVVGKKKLWHVYLIEAREQLEMYHEDGNAELFWKTLTDYRDVVKALNHKADSELLGELDRIAERLDDIRGKLSAGQHAVTA